MLAQLCRDPTQTRQAAEASAKIAAEHGLSFWLAGGGVMTGWSTVAMGNADEGIRQLRQGLLDWHATGSATYRTYYLALLADTLAGDGQFADAHGALDEALKLVDRTDERFFEAELHRLRGELYVKEPGEPNRGSAALAEAAFHRALDLSRRQEARSLQLRAAMSLARLRRLKKGSQDESQRPLAEIYGLFNQGLDTPDLREARILVEG
jgi:adenylate cyclase